MKQLIRKTLLVLLGGVLCSSAWGTTIETMGANDAGWGASGNNVSYTLTKDKTLILDFTVASTLKADAVNGWIIQALESDDESNEYFFIQPNGGFSAGGWWQWSNIKYSATTGGATQNNEGGKFQTALQGASVKITIQRLNDEVVLLTEITPTAGDKLYHRFVRACGNGTQDVKIVLGADNAVLTGITDTTVGTAKITGTLVGNEDNVGNGDEVSTGQSVSFNLANESSKTISFKNYTSKIGFGDNWIVRVDKDTKYFYIRSDFWGGESDGAGYYFRSLDNSQPGNFTLESTSGNYWNDFLYNMDGALVDMIITRSSNTITIKAEMQSTVSTEKKTQTYTLTHSDFASGDVTITLAANYAHLDILPESIKIGTTGWGTYVSEYNLDFSKAEEGLTAYKVTEKDGSSIKTEELTGVVNAGTPMLFKAATASKSYAVPVATAAGEAITGNCLKAGNGSAVKKETGFDRYVMVASSGKAVFKLINAKPATVNKNRAYLEFVAGGGEAHELLSLDGDDVTAIKNIKVGSEDNVYYNLNGQRVLYPTKGLYIVNGKKVIIK